MLDAHTLAIQPVAAYIEHPVPTRSVILQRSVGRQAYLSGVDAARLYRDFRTRGLRPRPLRRTLHTWAWLVVRSPWLLSADRRPIWVRRGGEALGRAAGSIRFRVVFL